MKIKFPYFSKLLQKVKSWRSPKNIPAGSVCLVLHSETQYQALIDALADAKTWTGIDYPKKVLASSNTYKSY